MFSICRLSSADSPIKRRCGIFTFLVCAFTVYARPVRERRLCCFTACVPLKPLLCNCAYGTSVPMIILCFDTLTTRILRLSRPLSTSTAPFCRALPPRLRAERFGHGSADVSCQFCFTKRLLLKFTACVAMRVGNFSIARDTSSMI